MERFVQEMKAGGKMWELHQLTDSKSDLELAYAYSYMHWAVCTFADDTVTYHTTYKQLHNIIFRGTAAPTTIINRFESKLSTYTQSKISH